MMRLIHPSGGKLSSLGGVPIESVSREAIGDLIGYVGQNPFVFSGTIAENIAYGCEHATIDQIREAARMACIDKEIANMPGEFQARVSERGQNLSGGQRQRIALARVFLKNPPILILDEGTSALDNISERRVQRAIHAARDRPDCDPGRPPTFHTARHRPDLCLRRRACRRDRDLQRPRPGQRRLHRTRPVGRRGVRPPRPPLHR